jgi:hypothetical protein
MGMFIGPLFALGKNMKPLKYLSTDKPAVD